MIEVGMRLAQAYIDLVEPFIIDGGGSMLLEDFDSISTGKSMPRGWTGDTGNDVTHNINSLGLVDGPLTGPIDGSNGTAVGLLNLGGSAERFEGSAEYVATWKSDLVRDRSLDEGDVIFDAAEDRALGIGRVEEDDTGTLTYEIEIGNAPLRAFTLDWGLEIWGGDPENRFRDTDGGGFVANVSISGTNYYNRTASHKPGELFYTDFDGANTNRNTTLIDGNTHSVRDISSEIVEVNAIDGAVGNAVSLTFDANYGDHDKGWISAIDNVGIRALAPGDVDGNGSVDPLDIVELLKGGQFDQGPNGVTWQQGDFNGDDKFDPLDLVEVLTFLSGQFPASYASEVGTNSDVIPDGHVIVVPEPSTWILLTVGGLFLVGWRQGAKRRSPGNNTMYGDGGDDYMRASGGNDLLEGGADDDFLSGSSGVDTIKGDGGDDSIWGGDDVDTICGHDGADDMWGNNDPTGPDAGDNYPDANKPDGDTVDGVAV